MHLFDTTQSTLEQALRGSAMRNEALAANLANVNTPNYQRKDVDFHGALQKALGTGDPEGADLSIAVEGSRTVRADGSGVDADQEAALLAQNGLEYQALVAVSKARIDVIRAAMGS